jgi:hypothetical protein
VDGKNTFYAPNDVLFGLQRAAKLLQLVEDEDNLCVFAASLANSCNAVFKESINVILQIFELVVVFEN